MVPIMEPDPTQEDRRKGKRLYWKEAKICLAHAQGSRTLVYGGTLQGDVRQAGEQLFDCAGRAGFGKNTRLHAVGDGAEWIVAQVEEQFGSQGGYLVDFYHVCNYLGDAAKALHPEGEAATAWVDTQKDRLKSGCADAVIQTLKIHLEPAETPEDAAPVRRCHRYLSHRKDQLDYPGAIARDLPIGSGEIESAHRYIVQQRLKRPGAWWRPADAEHMLACCCPTPRMPRWARTQAVGRRPTGNYFGTNWSPVWSMKSVERRTVPLYWAMRALPHRYRRRWGGGLPVDNPAGHVKRRSP